MHTQADFLKHLVEKLTEAGIPFMVVGSVAASYHGHPRSTLNIDAVVDANEETLCGFARSPGKGYNVREESVREAVQARTAFNIIDEASGYKADLIVWKKRPFSDGIRPTNAGQRPGKLPGDGHARGCNSLQA